MTPELYVTDIRSSLEFYVAILGFSVEYERPSEGFAVLALGSSRLMLEQTKIVRPATEAELLDGHWVTAPLEPPFGRGINFEIEVEELAPIRRRVLDAAIPFVVPLHEKTYGVGEGGVTVRQFVVADPDGYLIRPSETLAHA